MTRLLSFALATIIAFLIASAISYAVPGAPLDIPALLTGMVIGSLLHEVIIQRWRIVAWIVSRPRIATWVIERAKRTPYYPITRTGNIVEVYMDRWWVFNPYGKPGGVAGKTEAPRWPWLPSIRVHHIHRADDDDHMHDHPWDARTIVLRGWYHEERPIPRKGDSLSQIWDFPEVVDARETFARERGYTGPVKFNQFHRISQVSPGGVYTLWFTWRYQGTWGFLVDGKKVPWREYLGIPQQ